MIYYQITFGYINNFSFPVFFSSIDYEHLIT